MLNTLDHYIPRSLDHITGQFTHDSKLEQKVSYIGSYLPYWGNTVVFDLDGRTKQRLAAIRDGLHDAAGFMLADKLNADTFHMTLHDLVNHPGFPQEDEAADRAAAGARSLIEQWRGQKPLQMRGTWIFNMCQTSVVLGLVPNNHETYLRLCRMYDDLQQVVPLDYDLCPHITLAYFKPGMYEQHQVQALRSYLHMEPIIMDLAMEDLHLQSFTDMNHYENVF